MKIKLNNGIELTPLTIIGEEMQVLGVSRDVLTFVFADTENISVLDELFNTENCEEITVYDENSEYKHNAYTIRVKIEKTPEIVAPATPNSQEIIEQRIKVKMGQRTFVETQLAEQKALLDKLLASKATNEQAE